ncbi:MAG: hypothetical protein JRF34_03610 [Deltaproteobacteria bacterium]|nr:hypothetical protein [Deltaproteobacteria bacterium]
MGIKTCGTLIIAVTLLVNIFTGCGSPDRDGLSLKDIPRYPNATTGESMEQSSFGGIVEGNLAQFTTTDSYDAVVDFYTEALTNYDTELISLKSELGRQTVISMPQENRMTSVAIQEFSEQGKVNITLMEAGS